MAVEVSEPSRRVTQRNNSVMRGFTHVQGGLRCKQLLSKELQSVSLVCIIRNSTHQIMLDAPADVSAVMVHWLASAGSSAGTVDLAPCPRA
jgi:hypothetical protein